MDVCFSSFQFSDKAIMANLKHLSILDESFLQLNHLALDSVIRYYLKLKTNDKSGD